MIKVDHIYIHYRKSLLEDASIKIANGRLTCLIGESGIGKTSLLYLLGLISPTDKRTVYTFNNHQINLKADEEKALFRRQHIGYVFQENNLFDYMSIEENFLWIAQMSGKIITKEEMKNYLQLVKLPHLDIKKNPKTLSGGERQRLNVALVLSKKPKLLLLDEPTSALDNTNKHILIEILKDILKQEKIAVLVVTHDDYVKAESDCIYEIINHKIICSKDIDLNDTLLRLEHNNTKISKYLAYYSLMQLKRNMIFYIIGFLFSGLVLGGCIFFQSFSHDYQQMIHATYGQTRLSEIRVIDPNLSVEDYTKLKNDHRITNIYSYALFQVNSITINQQIVEKDIIIEFYNERMYPHQGIYISESIEKIIGSNNSLSVLIDEQFIQGTIVGNIGNDYASLYSSNKNLILIPVDDYQEIMKEQLIYVNDVNAVDGVMQLLRVLQPNIELQNQGSTVQLVQTAINDISQMGILYTAIIFLIIVMMLFNIYNRILGNRKMEFVLLKTNGLTKKNIHFIMNIEILAHIFLMSLFSLCSYILFTVIFYYYYQLNFISNYIIVILKCILLSGISVILISGISLYRLNKYEPSTLLRKEI